MSEYVPQAWRFGDGPNQYYADQYAQSMARLDYDLDYPEVVFDEHKAEFLADLAAHDREVKAEAWDEGVSALLAAHRWNNAEPWIPLVDNPYRIESQETP